MSKTVLTVDDSPSMRMMLRAELCKQGYDVREAADGVEALEILDEVNPDVVISDINMPRMNGYELIENIRCKGLGNLPILVLSTESSPEKRQRARDAGATGWIVKPFDPAKLSAALRRVLQ